MNTVKDLIFAQSLGSTKFIYFEDYTLKLPNETTCIILMRPVLQTCVSIIFIPMVVMLSMQLFDEKGTSQG